MYVSDEEKIIWLCVPGTGTRSFEKAAKKKIEDLIQVKHSKVPETDIPMSLHFPAFVAKNIIPKEKWDTYEKIAFIRDPYTWMNSIYNHHNIANIGFTCDSKKGHTFASFVKMNNKTPYYWYLDRDGTMLIDTLYKTEELKDTIFKRFDLDYLHINTTSFKKPKNEYTPELDQIMKKRFWRELEYYGRIL